VPPIAEEDLDALVEFDDLARLEPDQWRDPLGAPYLKKTVCELRTLSYTMKRFVTIVVSAVVASSVHAQYTVEILHNERWPQSACLGAGPGQQVGSIGNFWFRAMLWRGAAQPPVPYTIHPGTDREPSGRMAIDKLEGGTYSPSRPVGAGPLCGLDRIQIGSICTLQLTS